MATKGVWYSTERGNYHAEFEHGYRAQIMFVEDEWQWEVGRKLIEFQGVADGIDDAMIAVQSAIPRAALLTRAETGEG